MNQLNHTVRQERMVLRPEVRGHCWVEVDKLELELWPILGHEESPVTSNGGYGGARFKGEGMSATG
jgi:hypothetical protein